MKKSHDGRLAVILVVVLMLIDQVIKILVKTNMRLHESIEVTSWFYPPILGCIAPTLIMVSRWEPTPTAFFQ